MYAIIEQIINHTWSTQSSGAQGYVYSICAVIICLFFVTAIDWVFRLFGALFNKHI